MTATKNRLGINVTSYRGLHALGHSTSQSTIGESESTTKHGA